LPKSIGEKSRLPSSWVNERNRLISAIERWNRSLYHGKVLAVKNNSIGIIPVLLATCFTTLALAADGECPAVAKAVPLCAVLADASKYDGKEITVTGLYRMVIHGSILMSPACGQTYVNMRQASDYKADKHAAGVVRSLTKKDQFQSVDVVLRGTFRVAAREQCFGQNCLQYEIEDHELQRAKAPEADGP
jgi:hypothetical protein